MARRDLAAAEAAFERLRWLCHALEASGAAPDDDPRPPASPVEEEAPVDSDDEVIWDSARARPPAEIEAEALRMDATAAAEAHNEYLIGIGIAFDDDSDSD